MGKEMGKSNQRSRIYKKKNVEVFDMKLGVH